MEKKINKTIIRNGKTLEISVKGTIVTKKITDNFDNVQKTKDWDFSCYKNPEKMIKLALEGY